MSSPDRPGAPPECRRTPPSRVPARLSEALRAAGTAHARVLVDGPSGSGKSTLADALAAQWPGPTAPALVRLDDLYPGWCGLEAAAEAIVAGLLEPLAAGEPGWWQRYDWASAAPAERHVVPAGSAVIVEGCGALTRASAVLADVRVWVEAEPAVRRRRALSRDEGSFDAHWSGWERQFARLVARECSRSLADVVLDTTDGVRAVR